MRDKTDQGQTRLAAVRGEGYSPARWGKDLTSSSITPLHEGWPPHAVADDRGLGASTRSTWSGPRACTEERGHVRQG